MNSFFVSCEFIFRSIFCLQIITLCSVIVIMFATEAMVCPCFIHVHIFMISL